MRHRVDLDFIGLGNAARAYGGSLNAWSYYETDGQSWFDNFRQHALASIGNHYLPVYRMADGEYKFLFGRRFNRHKRPLYREVLGVTAEKLRLGGSKEWKTSWGESYSSSEVHALRQKLFRDIKVISQNGYLACYINDNGLNAFVEYNTIIEKRLLDQDVVLSEENYVPFHFAPALLINRGWEEFLKGRSILVATSYTAEKAFAIESTLRLYGAKAVRFIPLSPVSALKDVIDLSQLDASIDIALVAAGIGSANVLRQLKGLNTLCIDIGGFMNCIADPAVRQHGGVIGLPPLTGV